MKEEISSSDIARRRNGFDQESQTEYGAERSKAKRNVIYHLARNNYDGVLELVVKYNLTIEKSLLSKLADYESKSHSCHGIGLAMRAYRMLGRPKEADKLESRYKDYREAEHWREVQDVWVD